MKGLELSRRFFFEAVQPILERRFPEVQYAAALIGYGSEVVGLDDEMSQDHEWGPRVQLFTEQLNRAPEMERVLADELPRTFAGFPTNFGPTGEVGTVWRATGNGSQSLNTPTAGPSSDATTSALDC